MDYFSLATFGRKITVLCFSTLLINTLSGLPAQAAPPLADDQHITNSLMSAAVADTIRKNCSSLNARLLLALRKAKDLEKYAVKLGYSEAEIKAFVGSKEQRARITAITKAYLAEHDVVKGQEKTYCALGRAEMNSGSLIGSLLWSW